MKLEKQTRGFRAWLDQMDCVNRMLERDPELGWSEVVWRGLDKVIEEWAADRTKPLLRGD